jgi:hypothetical protein
MVRAATFLGLHRIQNHNITARRTPLKDTRFATRLAKRTLWNSCTTPSIKVCTSGTPFPATVDTLLKESVLLDSSTIPTLPYHNEQLYILVRRLQCRRR